LRSIPDKLGGVLAMGGAIAALATLPILNTSEIRNTEFRPLFGLLYWFLVSDFILLGWIGQKPVEDPYILIGICATIFYFFFFFIIIPTIGLVEKRLVQSL